MKTIRVLSLDGGGMRGFYTASYLDCLAIGFAKRRGVAALDIGKAFDLIVGTSTGAIIACALGSGVPLRKVIELYKKHGTAIFPIAVPTDLIGTLWNLINRPKALETGDKALRSALEACLGSTTLGQVYKTREIGIAIPAVELEHHHSFVFKTPHLAGSNHRDDDYTLVDACLASSAAPIYRSLAAIDNPNHSDNFRVFADGGLWANNPVLVGLVDALSMTEQGDRIEVFCMGTCPRPSGEYVEKHNIHRGLLEWKFGGGAATLAIDSQEFAYDNIARMLVPHLNRDCHVMRFPWGHVPGEMLKYLELDDTSAEAARALSAQAQRDAEMTNSRSNDEKDYEGSLIKNLFMNMPLM
jgi:hypothetical protein